MRAEQCTLPHTNTHILLLQGINKSVEIHECVQSKVDVGSLLGIRAFSLDKMLAEDPDFLVGQVWGSVRMCGDGVDRIPAQLQDMLTCLTLSVG